MGLAMGFWKEIAPLELVLAEGRSKEEWMEELHLSQNLQRPSPGRRGPTTCVSGSGKPQIPSRRNPFLGP